MVVPNRLPVLDGNTDSQKQSIYLKLNDHKYIYILYRNRVCCN